MNNTIETNESYQKFKEILTARHVISQWLSTGSVFSKLFQVLLRQVIASLSPNDCYLFDKQSLCTIQYLIAAN